MAAGRVLHSAGTARDPSPAQHRVDYSWGSMALRAKSAAPASASFSKGVSTHPGSHARASGRARAGGTRSPAPACWRGRPPAAARPGPPSPASPGLSVPQEPARRPPQPMGRAPAARRGTGTPAARPRPCAPPAGCACPSARAPRMHQIISSAPAPLQCQCSVRGAPEAVLAGTARLHDRSGTRAHAF